MRLAGGPQEITKIIDNEDIEIYLGKYTEDKEIIKFAVWKVFDKRILIKQAKEGVIKKPLIEEEYESIINPEIAIDVLSNAAMLTQTLISALEEIFEDLDKKMKVASVLETADSMSESTRNDILDKADSEGALIEIIKFGSGNLTLLRNSVKEQLEETAAFKDHQPTALRIPFFQR